jgi:hypothetical protein
MTAAARSKAGTMTQPGKPSPAPSHSKTLVSLRPPIAAPHAATTAQHGQSSLAAQGSAVAVKSDASDGAASSRRPAAPARAVILTSLIQLMTVAMNLRLRHRRSLRAIERNLADSDPSLTRLFSTFTVLTHSEERGWAEKVKARPLRALARRLATALEFDPADPWRRAK